MFYGVIHEDYLYEFDIKGAIENIRKAAAKAILNFIHKIESLINKCKDSKAKSAFKSLLDRTKKLFGEAEKIESQEDANKIKEDFEDCKKELERVEGEILSPEESEKIDARLKAANKEDKEASAA